MVRFKYHFLFLVLLITIIVFFNETFVLVCQMLPKYKNRYVPILSEPALLLATNMFFNEHVMSWYELNKLAEQIPADYPFLDEIFFKISYFRHNIPATHWSPNIKTLLNSEEYDLFIRENFVNFSKLFSLTRSDMI